MKKTIALLLTVMLLASLGACGSKTPAVDVSGTYNATSCTVNGSEYSCDGEYVTLKADGTGTVMFMGTEYDIDWKLDGDKLSFTDSDGDTFEGTCSNGVIQGVYANMDYVYEMGAASGKSKTADSETQTAQPDTAVAAPANAGTSGATALPAAADWEDASVSILSAEQFTDSDGNPAVRFYYDYTNNSEDTTSAWMALGLKAYQDGYELVGAYASYEDDVPEYGNDSLDVRPGVTIRCVTEYTFKPDGGLIEFTISDYWNEDDELTAQFDPQNLPGRPAEDWTAATVADPQWLAGLESGGVYDDDYQISISKTEFITDSNGDPAIRVYFDYTNNSADTSTFFMSIYYRAMQDGIELSTIWPDQEVAEDENDSVDVAPGDSITTAEVYRLRSSSPVEIEVYSNWGSNGYGIVVPVA